MGGLRKKDFGKAPTRKRKRAKKKHHEGRKEKEDIGGGRGRDASLRAGEGLRLLQELTKQKKMQRMTRPGN